MSMNKRMTIAEAQTLARDIEAGRKKFGAQFSPQASPRLLVEAISVLAGSVPVASDSPTRDEYNKLARQLGACKARETKMIKRIGEVNNEDDAAQLKSDTSDASELGGHPHDD